MARPVRARSLAEQAAYKEVQDLNRAFSVVRQAEHRLTKLMTDAGIHGAHVQIVGNGYDEPVVHLGASSKVFLHPSGKRIYESVVTTMSRAPLIIAEVAAWLMPDVRGVR